MIITKIGRTKKGNVSIYADSNYLCSIPPEVFVKSGLKKGAFVDENSVNSILSDSRTHKAKEKALTLLSFRAHSKKELKNKIMRTSDEKNAECAVARMEQLGLVNDFEFALSYARELISRKFCSLKKVKYELTQKGVASDVIEQVLEEINADEYDIIKKLIKKKYANKLNDEKNLRKTISALQRMGYSWSEINLAIKQFDE